ncbi:MAG: tetratricopeptide repeat protein [Planctomycetota bacterium]|jgi:Flp pilus assembly protein TadD
MSQFLNIFIFIGIFLSFLLTGCTESGQLGGYSNSRNFKLEGEVKEVSNLPPTAKTLYSMAEILAVQSRDSESEFVLRQCISEYPDFSPAYNSLAELQMRHGRINEAMGTLTKGSEISPQDSTILNNLGMCYLLREEYEKSLELFTQAAGVSPEKTRYRANMAVALSFMGRDEEALALYLQIMPTDKAEKNIQILKENREKGNNVSKSFVR